MRNIEYINFCGDELFTCDSLDQFLHTNPLEKSRMISEKLMEYFIVTNEVLYTYDSVSCTYHVVKQPVFEYLVMMCRRFTVQSYESLTVNEKKVFRDFAFSLGWFQDFIRDVYNMITNNDIVFNKVPKHITHYKNGYFDAKKNKFFPRDPETHFITDYIDQDYCVPVRKSKVTVQVQVDDESDNEDEEEDNPFDEDDEQEEEVIVPTKSNKRISKESIQFLINDL